MKKIILYSVCLVFIISIISAFSSAPPKIVKNEKIHKKTIKKEPEKFLTDFPAPEKGCLTCHKGIAPIRDHNSEMMRQIYAKGAKLGDPNGCVVCHQGDVSQIKNKKLAHKNLIKHPGSVWVKDKTCGQCHKEHVYNEKRSLMQTEAGKIQGALWGWGATLEGYATKYGNYDLDDPDGNTPVWGTDVYKNYIHKLAKKYPGNFPDHLEQLPDADVNTINEHPEQGVLTYLRSECLRCHVGVRGKQRRGDYRGTGCAACHIPYSDVGFYEGNDPTIPKDVPGHLLVHSIQSSRKTKVKLHGKSYSGIPSETCTTCHNRGKRIGVSYLGIMEQPYGTTFNSDGSKQYKLHGKYYHFIQDDAHHSVKSRKGNPKGGLLCQDCHTTVSMHGNGNIDGTTLASVETECADCHGTPKKYPWELPIGYGDEFGAKLNDTPRGTSDTLLIVTRKFSTVYPKEDGYILSARGNPYGNVVRKGDEVIVHSASGLDFKVPVLKKMTEENSWEHPDKAVTAMVNIGKHIDKMECYSCHSTWAPQCYGCHVKVDYSKGAEATDWLKTGGAHFPNGETSETQEGEKMKKLKGKVTESRTYTRWENPILGINGEGRVTPIIPGCQQITTVIGTDGKPVFVNKIWRTPPGTENGGKEGQRGMDMSPAQPHTVTKEARSCMSCHADPKALGYGVNDGKYMKGYETDRYADLRNAQGENISNRSTPQFSKIEDLPMDLSQVVTREGKQIQTVGHHWDLSAPLSQEQREHMERVGTCIACHKDIPDGNLSMRAITSAGDMLGMSPHSDKEHADLLNNDINFAASVKVFAPILLFFIALIWFFRRRRKRKH